MKRVLIISPHFPPINAADMQRIRMSLPYFKELGWEAEVVMVDVHFTDLVQDELLTASIPADIKIYKVKAFDKKLTQKIGLGSLALRSMWFYWKKVNQLLKRSHYDLIYFSTTEFPLCILGTYWKKKYGVPFVIDMQDPWYSDHYEDKPKKERPKKYWLAYQLHKFLEPIAMYKSDGLISVSEDYIKVLKERYPNLKNKPSSVITFGAFDLDFTIAIKNDDKLALGFPLKANSINLVYIGRGGFDMKDALTILFKVFKKGLDEQPMLFSKINMYFIGTSYAPKGKGIPTIKPIAEEMGLTQFVKEYTDRIGFYESIKTLKNADGLVIIGSDQAAYTASKLYPYVLAEKPLLAILHAESSASKIMTDCNAGQLIRLDDSIAIAYPTLLTYLEGIKNNIKPQTNWDAFESHSAKNMTKLQVELFNRVVLN